MYYAFCPLILIPHRRRARMSLYMCVFEAHRERRSMQLMHTVSASPATTTESALTVEMVCAVCDGSVHIADKASAGDITVL